MKAVLFLILSFFLSLLALCQTKAADKGDVSLVTGKQKFLCTIDTMYRPNGNAVGLRYDTAFFASNGRIMKYVSKRIKLPDSKDTLTFFVPSFQIVYSTGSNVKVSLFETIDQLLPQAVYTFRNGLVRNFRDPKRLSDSNIALSLVTEYMRMDFSGGVNIRWRRIGQSKIQFFVVTDEHPAYSIFKLEGKIIRVPFSIHSTFLNLFQSDPTAFDSIFKGCGAVPIVFSEISYLKYFEKIGVEGILFLDRATEYRENNDVVIQMLQKSVQSYCDPVIRLRNFHKKGQDVFKLVSLKQSCPIP